MDRRSIDLAVASAVAGLGGAAILAALTTSPAQAIGAALLAGGVILLAGGVLLVGRLYLTSAKAAAPPAAPAPLAQGGAGGHATVRNGVAIGGQGGRVGPGGVGIGGAGGSSTVIGDGVAIGGMGGSVDGHNIWFPPAVSDFALGFLPEGETPDFGVPLPGQGGASGGYNEKFHIVSRIRQAYFEQTGQPAKLARSKIADVPLGHINATLAEMGLPWRARYEREHWYLFYIP